MIMKIFRALKLLIFFLIAILLKPFCQTRKFKNLVVIGSRHGKTGYDNGEMLHQYLLSKNLNVQLIADRYNKNDRVVKFNSLYSIICVLNSNVKIVTHSEADLFDYWWRLIPHLNVCCIQHGVIGIKRLKEYEVKKFDKFLISTTFERKILNEYYGMENESILEIGLPRFDAYEYKENISINSCLILPTWRKEKLSGEEVFSNFAMLAMKLADKITDVNFYIAAHPEVDLINNKDFAGRNLFFIESDDIHEKIKNCDLLITDYSSIAWDFLYMGKFIAFYTPDYEKFSESQGLYCEFEKMLGFHIHLDDLNCEDLLEKIIFENKIKNNDFLTDFRFFNHKMKSHSEELLKALLK